MTIAFRDADIPALFADFGVPVVIGGVSGLGLLDENDQVLVTWGGLHHSTPQGQVAGDVHTVTVQTSKFPAIALGLQIIVDGIVGSVRQKFKEGDGGLTKILIGDVSGITVPPTPQVGIIDGGTF